MADDNLNVHINVDQNSSEIDATIAKFQLLQGGIKDANAAHVKGAESATKHAEAEGILGASLGKVEAATNSAARVFSAIGLNTAEATERVEGLSEALDGLGKAALPLLAVGAAVLAVAEAFNFLKDGVDEATKTQAAMASLGQAVTNQGGNWKTAQAGVESFLDAVEHATTYSRGEALDALNSLTTAGMSLADSEKVVAIATDVAAASHRSLQDVVDKLKEAEAGRGRGLVELDEKLKPLIDSHAKLSVVLNQLASDMRNQAAAALDTNAGKAALLRNELSHLAEELGDELLPAINVGIEVISEFAEGMEQHEPQIKSFFDTVIKSAEVAGNALVEFGKLNLALGKGIADSAMLKFGDANNEIGNAENAMAALLAGPKGVGDPIGTALKRVSDEYAKERADAIAQLNKFRDQSLQNDVTLGKDATTNDTKAPFSAGPEISDETKLTSGLSDAQKELDATLKALTSSEGEYKENVKLATSAVDENSAKAALANKQTVDAVVSINLLKTAIATERTELAAATAEETRHQTAADALAAAYKSLQAQVEAAGRSTTQQKQELKDLYAAWQLHTKGVTDAQSAESTLTSDINTNSAALEENRQKAQSNAEAQAELNRTISNSAAAWQAAQNEQTINGILKLGELQEQLAGEESIYGKSLQQQLAYYKQREQIAIASYGQDSEEAYAAAEKVESIELDMYKQRADAQKEFMSQIQSGEETLVDDIISKHEDLKTTLNSIWKEILSDFEKNIEQMLLKGQLLGGLNNELAKLLGVGGSGGVATAGGIAGGSGLGSATTGAGSAGIFGSLFGSQGASQIASSLPTTGGITGLMFGTSSSSAMGADTSSSSPGAQPGGGADMSNAGGGGANWGSGSSVTAGDALGGALSGVGEGELAASLDSGNSLWGSVGGGLGGLVGTILGGPTGGAIGGGLGGLIGSLFGPKNANAYGQPDNYDTQNYGQTIADLVGTAGADGQNFYESSTDKSLFNGQDALAGIEEMLAQGQSSFTSSTGLSAAFYQQLVAELGTRATGSGQLQHGTNIGDLSVTGASGAGETFRYSDFETQLNELTAAIEGKGGNSAIPTFSVTRSYATPGTITGLTSDGLYTPTASNLLGTPTTSTTTSTQSTVAAISNAVADAMNGTPQTGRGLVGKPVQVTINGNVVGPGGLESVAQEIGIALGRYQGGLIPGAGSGVGSKMRRFTGGS